MPANPQLQKLLQIPIFRGLTEKQAAAVLEIAEERALKEGEAIFAEGDAGDGLYVLLEGAVEIQKRDHSGRSQALAKLGDGAAIGEMSLLAGDAPRSASAIAASDARVLKLASARFARLLGSDDIAALKIIFNLAQVMARRLQLLDEKVVDLMDQGKRKEELADFQRILNNWSF